MAHVANVNPDTEYDAIYMIPLSQLRRNLLSLGEELKDVSDMIDLTGQNLTRAEILNWLKNDEDLLPLEDIDGTDEQHESENEGQELKNTNQTVKNDEAVKSFNVYIKWAEENIPMNDVFILQRLKETTFIMNQKRIKQTKITSYFRK